MARQFLEVTKIFLIEPLHSRQKWCSRSRRLTLTNILMKLKSYPCNPDSSLKRAKSDSDFSIRADSEFNISEIEAEDEIPIVEGGRGLACTGKVRWGYHGKNVIIKCPINVDIRDVKTGKVIATLTKHKEEVLIAKGGLGGKGLTGMGIDRKRWNSLKEKQRAKEWMRSRPTNNSYDAK